MKKQKANTLQAQKIKTMGKKVSFTAWDELIIEPPEINNQIDVLKR